MGWSYGIVDGREVGYSIDATCDYPGCTEEIDRGLSFVCGTMHGEDEYSCANYYCEKHKTYWIKMDNGKYTLICEECVNTLLESGEWVEDKMEGVIVRKIDGEPNG